MFALKRYSFIIDQFGACLSMEKVLGIRFSSMVNLYDETWVMQNRPYVLDKSLLYACKVIRSHTVYVRGGMSMCMNCPGWNFGKPRTLTSEHHLKRVCALLTLDASVGSAEGLCTVLGPGE